MSLHVVFSYDYMKILPIVFFNLSYLRNKDDDIEFCDGNMYYQIEYRELLFKILFVYMFVCLDHLT